MNTNFSGLDSLSKYDIIKKAFNHKLKYKCKIGLSKKIKFGIELEALGSDFIRNLRDNKKIYFYEDNPSFKPRDIYGKNRWILYNEDTLYDENNIMVRNPNELYDMLMNGEIGYLEYEDMRFSLANGGEIASPILKDSIKSWHDVKCMLKYMKKNVPDLRINDSCSFHTHFDIGIFENNPELLYSFIILLAENEDILSRFYCGEYINLRKYVRSWAKPIKPLVRFGLDFPMNMNSNKELIRSLYLGSPKMKEYSFDFWEIYNNFYPLLSSTFENRVSNGTLNINIIQNSIMLMGFLMEYVSNRKYDLEHGIYNLKNEIINDPFYVADMLPNDEYKLDFLTQYYKDGMTTTSNKLVKSKRIFY